MKPLAPLLVPAAVLLVVGCARTAEERQLDAMRADLDRIQHEHDLDTSGIAPDSAELRPPDVPARPPAGLPAASAGSAAISSGVVRVGTSDDLLPDDYEDPEDTSPRPKIRVLGAPRVGGRGSWRSDQQLVEGLSDDGTGSPALGRGMVLDPEAKRAYDAALSLVNARQYSQALAALAAFLVKWPDHPYVDHAMYWRGECYFARADYVAASEQFEGVIASFPAGSKAPDALLKLGICHQKLGHIAEAKASFDRLLQEYPQSEAARRASSLASPDGKASVNESGPPSRRRGPAPEDPR